MSMAVLQNHDDGTQDKPYGHCLVAGVDRFPRKVTKRMGKKRVKDRSKIKAFIKVINYNHLMPTRSVCYLFWGGRSYFYHSLSLQKCVSVEYRVKTIGYNSCW